MCFSTLFGREKFVTVLALELLLAQVDHFVVYFKLLFGAKFLAATLTFEQSLLQMMFVNMNSALRLSAKLFITMIAFELFQARMDDFVVSVKRLFRGKCLWALCALKHVRGMKV